MADGKVKLDVDIDLKNATSELKKLESNILALEKKLNAASDKRSGIEDQFKSASASVDETKAKIAELQGELRQIKLNLSVKGPKGLLPEEFNAQQQAQAEVEYELKQQQAILAQQESTASKLKAQRDSALASEKNIVNELKSQYKEYNNLSAKVAGLEEQANSAHAELDRATRTADGFKNVRAAIDEVHASMKKGFKNILRWGLGIRSIFFLLRKLRGYVKEAVSAFAEQDAETKATINGLKASLNGLKLAWGAAFAPILNAVAPLLQKLISWLTSAANAISAFFAALGGEKKYKKVVGGLGDIENAASGAGGAAEEAQKQLMGFDELNVLNKDSAAGGGGGGGASGELGEMTKELIPDSIMNKVQWLKDHMDEILKVVEAIGAAFLAWKLVSILSKLGLMDKSLLNILAVAMIIYGLVDGIRTFIDQWKNGLDLAGLDSLLTDILLIATGLYILLGPTAAAIGLIVGGIALLVLGFKEWIETGNLSLEACRYIQAGILLVGGAIMLLTGSWIPLAIAAVAALALEIYRKWDDIKAWIKEAGEKIDDFFGGNLSKTIEDFVSMIKGQWDNIKKVIDGALDFITGVLTLDIDLAFQGIQEMLEGFGGFWKETFEGIRNIVDDVTGGIRSAIENLRNIHIPTFHFDGWSSASWEIFGRTFTIPLPNIGWYAKGGIFDSASLIGVGEAGAEAVVPLERNTGWINKIADTLLDRLKSSSVGDLITGRMPAMAGYVAPPSFSASSLSDETINRLVQGIKGAVTGVSGNQNDAAPIIRLYIDGREISDVVTKYQRQDARAGG